MSPSLLDFFFDGFCSFKSLGKRIKNKGQDYLGLFTSLSAVNALRKLSVLKQLRRNFFEIKIGRDIGSP